MTRTEHLKFCSICVNQKDGMRKGIICGLTNEIADFEDACGSFAEDTEVIEQLKATEIENAIADKAASQGIQKLGLKKIPTSSPHHSAKNKIDISGET